MKSSTGYGLAATLTVAIVVLGAVGCGQGGARKGAASVPATSEELLTELKGDKDRIDRTTDAMIQRIDQFNRSRQPGQPTIQFSEVFSEELSPEQRDVLNSLLQEEQDISYRALLQKIIADRDNIRGLQERILRLEQRLPDKFELVKRGDTHYGLAMTYLTGENALGQASAGKLLSRVDLTDELLPGNKVWFFRDAGQGTFRTYVTQGEAGQTPLAVRRALKRRLITERDEARTMVADLQKTKFELETVNVSLEAENVGLAASKASLETDIRSLEHKKTTLESTVDRLSSDLSFRQNSLFYHAANEDALKKQGVLSSVLRRLRDVKGVNFDSALDLRRATTITLRPGTFGLDSIREVRLLPPIYQEGRDFMVETSQDASSARVVILDPDLFRGKEVVLAVGG